LAAAAVRSSCWSRAICRTQKASTTPRPGPQIVIRTADRQPISRVRPDPGRLTVTPPTTNLVDAPISTPTSSLPIRHLSSLKEGLVSRAPDGFLSGSVAARRAGGFVLGRVEARAVKGRPEAEREPERQRRLAATLEGPVIGHRHTGRRPLGLRGSALSIPMWGVLVPPAAVRRRCGLSPGPVDAGGQARGPGCRSSLRRGGAAWSVSAAAWRAQSSGRPRRR